MQQRGHGAVAPARDARKACPAQAMPALLSAKTIIGHVGTRAGDAPWRRSPETPEWMERDSLMYRPANSR
jgi:hypothetical protein